MVSVGPQAVLQVFGRVPVAGAVKTRLNPALGPAGAAALQRRLLLHAVQQARATGLPWEVWLDRLPDADLRRAIGADVDIFIQPDGDLGARMDAALNAALGRQRSPLLFGTDCPELDAGRLLDGARRLLGSTADQVDVVDVVDVVIAPAHDGGYGLIGVRTPVTDLLVDMTWGTATVLRETLQRAAAGGLRVVRLAPVRDIDEPGDLPWLAQHWPALANFEEPPESASSDP